MGIVRRVTLGIVTILLAAARLSLAEELPALFTRPAADNPSYYQVDAQLRQIPVFRGAFTQTKRILVLANPLVSTGRFVSSAEKGLYWRVITPFATETLFASDGIFQKDDTDTWKSAFPEGQAAVQSFVKVMRSVFAGDPRGLNQSFAVYFEGSLERWRIGLLPQSGQMQRFVRYIILHGAASIAGVEVAEGNGDYATIDFSDVAVAPRTLTNEEERQFVH